jgi:rhamnosyltransferase
MINILIPTLNAGLVLKQILKSLKGQSVPCEIVIADSSSSDETISIATSNNARAIKIRKEDFNHGRTRNLIASKSSGEIIVFMTQDAIPVDDHCIERLIAPLQKSEIVASFARQIPMSDASPLEQFARIFNYPDVPTVKGLEDVPRLGIKTFFFSNVCSAIKTKEFKELGGFPENIIMFEDLILAAKAILKGHKIAYVPEAAVWHSHNFSLTQQFRRYSDAGISLRNNAWIFNHTKASREGLSFLKQELLYLSRKHQYRWIPYAITESIFKLAGFWLGLHGIYPRRRASIASCISNNA